MSNNKYFQFLSDFWDMFPEKDKSRLAETWYGYEQVVASVYQGFVEADLNVSINDLQPYSTSRWLNYSFGPSNKVSAAAIYTSNQDLSQGVNLSNRFIIRIRVNGSIEKEVDCRGFNPAKTKIEEIINNINFTFGFNFARGIKENSLLQLVSNIEGIDSSIEILPASNEGKDCSEYILGLIREELPKRYPEYPYSFSIQYSNVVRIPILQDKIRDDSAEIVLHDDIDFKYDSSGILWFKKEPPAELWAKKTYYDDETPWSNFGYMMGIYQKNTPTYLSVLQGLWYAFWMGSKPDNITTALYLLFGLPVSKMAGVVTLVTDKKITVTATNGSVDSYDIPNELVPIVSVGQTVKTFEPLVNGIEILDKINKPGFIETEIGRVGIQRFLTPEASRGPGDTDETRAMRILEENTFLPQIAVEAFISTDINMGNVRLFLQSIKPLTKTFLFQVVVGNFKEVINPKESLSYSVDMNVTPTMDSNPTTTTTQEELDANEIIANPGLSLDTDVAGMYDELEITVTKQGKLVDVFKG